MLVRWSDVAAATNRLVGRSGELAVLHRVLGGLDVDALDEYLRGLDPAVFAVERFDRTDGSDPGGALRSASTSRGPR